jgi:hypothetical protein
MLSQVHLVRAGFELAMPPTVFVLPLNNSLYRIILDTLYLYQITIAQWNLLPVAAVQ